MIRSLIDLTDHDFHARDGDVGRIQDVYVDDRTWDVRYLVVETGKWLPGARKLLPPETVDAIDGDARQVHLALDREQIESSPDVDADPPVVRQQLVDLHAHYGLGMGWLAGSHPIDPVGQVPPATPAVEPPAEDTTSETRWDPRLRSTRELIGYDVYGRGSDDDVGSITDLACDDQHWQIRYAVADSRRWLPGKTFLVATSWIESVDATARRVHVDLDADTMRDAPPFDSREPINRRYEERLYDFYGRPADWAADRERRAEASES